MGPTYTTTVDLSEKDGKLVTNSISGTSTSTTATSFSDNPLSTVVAVSFLSGPKGEKGDTGEQGLKGDTGATGAKGDTGATGPTGPAGTAATVSVGSVTTGSPGSSASVSNAGTSSAAILNFTIPRGDTGATGSNGTNGTNGTAATIAVGTVTTGAAGSSATITNSGTSSAAVFDFTIPRGDTGASGSGTGDVVGPSSSTNNHVVMFNGTTGKLIKDSGLTLSGTNTGDQDLSGKVTANGAITGATKTKITYDAKGLVTSGTDATTADIADSTNKRYVTDAQQTVLSNTSGTNSGDNATNSQYSGLAASKANDSAVVHNTGNESVAGSKTFSDYAIFSNGMSLNNTIIDTLGTPIASNHAATKGYVDGSGLLIARSMPVHSWDYHLAGVSTANFATTLISSGTAAYVNTLSAHPGYMTITSSTTANSGVYSYLFNVTALKHIEGGEVYECIFQPKVASNTNTTIRFGLLDSTTSSDAVDGCYFELAAGTLALIGKTSSNSTRTSSSTIATLTVNTWYRGRIEVNAAATSVTFYLYDGTSTLLGSQSVTTNIPTASGREFGTGFIATNSGTTATLLAWLDYQAVQFGATSPYAR